MKQLLFDKLLEHSLNENAMPKKHGIDWEIKRNDIELRTITNAPMRYMIELAQRQQYLLRERQRC